MGACESQVSKLAYQAEEPVPSEEHLCQLDDSDGIMSKLDSFGDRDVTVNATFNMGAVLQASLDKDGKAEDPSSDTPCTMSVRSSVSHTSISESCSEETTASNPEGLSVGYCGTCRFCNATENIPVLLAPCVCGGPTRLCHYKCLLRWQAQNIRSGTFSEVCPVCQFPWLLPLELVQRTRGSRRYARRGESPVKGGLRGPCQDVLPAASSDVDCLPASAAVLHSSPEEQAGLGVRRKGLTL
mmetsp:Transcript_11006/g.25149  ORF Transcript_11006/g.25149 Transcript_11006/m.25149 type:complete len:241 (-) Transcript_11006:162-884(-)